MSLFDEMTEKRTSIFMTWRNLAWVGVALAMLAVHALLNQQYPEFVPPASPDKQQWIRVSLYSEFVVHLTYLGALLTVIRNSIPAWRDPRSDNDEVISLDSSIQFVSRNIRWNDIAIVILEFLVYVTLWAWCYALI